LPKDSGVEAKVDDPEPPPLSEEFEEDIRTLDKEVMDSIANNSSASKRTSSRRSIVLSETDTVQSRRSSNTIAHYRYKHLEDANVYIHADPPQDIQAAIDGITNAEPSEDCYTILRDKAKNSQRDVRKWSELRLAKMTSSIFSTR
jgi:hypothetical protein